MDEGVDLDLFGNPRPQVRGPGRPSHVPTAETRQFVNMQFVCGHDVMSVAKMMGLSRTAFYEHYRDEIAERKLAAAKFKGHQLLRLNKQALAGNVAAEKALAGMIASEQLKALAGNVRERGKAKDAKLAPRGIKEQRLAQAETIVGKFGPRVAPGQLLNS